MYSQRRSLRSATAAASSSAADVEEVDDEVNSQPVPGTSATLTDTQLSNQLNNVHVDDGSSDNDDVEEYGDMHRLVLQGVMAAGYLDAKGVKKLFQESSRFLKCTIPAATDIYPYIQKVVREINERIKSYDMMIRSATCEITGEKFYVFLVTIEKPIMKMQQYFAKAELDLFQKVLDSLLRKHRNFAMSKTECVNIAGELDNRALNKVNAEDFVDRMISMKYFTKVYKDNDSKIEEKDRDYDITLGFRTIREFELIFRDVYGDIFGNCCLCKMILLNGLQCPKCPVVVHRACLKKYIKNCKTCVSCKGIWKNEEALPVRTRDGGSDPSASSFGSSHDTSSHNAEAGQASRSHVGDDIDMPVLEPVVSPRTTRANQQSSPKGDRKSRKPAPKTAATRSSKRSRLTVASSSSSDSE